MHPAPDPWRATDNGPAAGGDLTPASVDDRAFRNVMARLGSGVCVLTTTDPVGRDCGLTVTAVSSLSLAPPLLIVAVRHGSFVHDALYVAEGFALTILAAEQLDLARYAARHRYPTDIDDFSRWSSAEAFARAYARWSSVRAAASGSLVFPRGVAAVDCVPYEFVDAGDHVIVIGRAVQTSFGCTGDVPLLHVDRGYYRPGERLD